MNDPEQKELIDERVANRRRIQFGHMRRVVSGEVDFNRPFGFSPAEFRPQWVRRKDVKRISEKPGSLFPKNL